MDMFSMQQKKSSLVVLTPGFPADEHDENCIPFLHSYLRYLSAKYPDLDIQVIAFQYPFRETSYRWHSLNVYSAGGANRKGVYRLNTWWKVWRRMRQIYNSSNVLAVHSFWLTECTFLAVWFCRLYQIRHVATVVGQDCLPSNRYLSVIPFSKCHVTSLSFFAADKLRETGFGSAADVISVGFNPADFPETPSDAPEYHIIGVGNLHRIKNYGLFVELIGSLRSEFGNLRCCLIGEGQLFDEIRSLVIQYKLEDIIEMPGALPRREVLKRMKRSLILLHPSLHEGQGYVFEEALYCGMLVVAFAVGNLKPCTRILIASDADDMLGKLKSALGSDFKRERYVLSEPDETASRYMNLYRNIKSLSQ